MQIVNSHKSIQLYEVVVTGREAHSEPGDRRYLGQHGRDRPAVDARPHRGGRGASPRPAFRSALVDAHRRHHPWRHGAQHPRARMPLHLRPALRAGPRCRRSAHAFLGCGRAGQATPRRPRATTPGITVERLAKVPSLRREPEGAPSDRRRCSAARTPPAPPFPMARRPGSSRQAGLSTVICGPGSITQAHRPDEFIELSQIEAGARFISRLVSFVRAG